MPYGDLAFGWVAPVVGTSESNQEPIVIFQEREVLPAASEHFDCVWLADSLGVAGEPHVAYWN